MKVKPILQQDQLNRDQELAYLTKVSIAKVQRIVIASPETIAIYRGDRSDLKKPEDITALYRNFSYL